MIETGDTFTVAGIHPLIRNPDRKWWQFWRPRLIPDTSRLQKFTVAP